MFRQAFLIFRYYLDLVIDCIFAFFWEGTKQKIPDLDPRHKILTESAVSLAAKIRNKQLKSEDLVRTCIERIKTVNPMLNAVVDERYENALNDARAVDEIIARGVSEDYFKDKPFLGVPFTSKESHGVAGLLNTLGLRARQHTKAPEDAECVRLLRAAGAIPVAVTNVPEVNKWQESRNMVFGQTNNPHHTGRTPGGSSGGEAALMAAVATPIALCSDIGGSTRMPAFFCGLYGLIPTAGHTSFKGSTLRDGKAPTMASISFVSRHLEDLAPLTAVVAADKAKQLTLDKKVNIQDIKFFYTEQSQDIRLSPICGELREAMSKVVKKLSSAASSTDRAPKPYYHSGLDYMFSLWRHGMTKEAEVFSRVLTNNTGTAKAWVEIPKKLLGLSEYTLAAILKLVDDQWMPRTNPKWAEKLTDDLKQDLINTLGDSGVLLFPSAPAPAPYHYSLLLRPYNFAYWGICNALHLPVAQVPLGLSSAGLPLGIQVVAAPRQEGLCLAAAAWLRQLGGCVPPCRLE
ncbi:fatty-acid amide hydrolase 2-like isoform X2 [Pectinophora gossypiella]|nr:fatty-acid amide hydrolase 2-like isoform X2 [Pectinophora gossypiella]XP_049876069.1 fatty-acid amide hydrolase 2-like isoform X2 [Pectinophora gossypiella]XP_049876070.1 fatty-acid amide hydrolase 2-like isoform X2 [Pectinophora gossypiella]XP_049876072.1 fatty-acid amide hydrolase 2-like isoform X2 [Pectinophora gossypiella]XP_049876073.1 fatty-acid amide hydrolase 2-like isoform X2 [Pectinophora gossypiella]